jgi:aspartate/methionine/tyrosine aminotransferase
VSPVACRRTTVGSLTFPPAEVIPADLGSPVDVIAARFDGFRLRIDAIERVLTADTGLVSVASPQNPSDVRCTGQEIRDLMTIVDGRSPDAFVFVDETYRASTYGDAAVPASMATLSARVVACSTLDETLASARLGAALVKAAN